jgi:hypothetical protein
MTINQRDNEQTFCLDGHLHNWQYKNRVRQDSGIGRSYYHDYYYCTKCLKETYKSGYYDGVT